eukprot:2515787-Prymnesium_polylepis.1
MRACSAWCFCAHAACGRGSRQPCAHADRWTGPCGRRARRARSVERRRVELIGMSFGDVSEISRGTA